MEGKSLNMYIGDKLITTTSEWEIEKLVDWLSKKNHPVS